MNCKAELRLRLLSTPFLGRHSALWLVSQILVRKLIVARWWAGLSHNSAQVAPLKSYVTSVLRQARHMTVGMT